MIYGLHFHFLLSFCHQQTFISIYRSETIIQMLARYYFLEAREIVLPNKIHCTALPVALGFFPVKGSLALMGLCLFSVFLVSL